MEIYISFYVHYIYFEVFQSENSHPDGGLRIGLVQLQQPAGQPPEAVVAALLKEELAVLCNERAGAVQDDLPAADRAAEALDIIRFRQLDLPPELAVLAEEAEAAAL